MFFDIFSGSSLFNTITGTIDGFFDEGDEDNGDEEDIS